jgi:hypothetical protein
LPTPRTSADVYQLFYPSAPAAVLTNVEDEGHLYRRDGFLTALDDGAYHSAAQFVLTNLDQVFYDIQAALRVGRHEGKLISQVMSHVVQWINPNVTRFADRENNKPPLWRDFVPSLTIQHGSSAERESRTLQRRIFGVIRSRLRELDGSLSGKVGDNNYPDRFEVPIWKEILSTVQTAVGPHFEGPLATFCMQLTTRVYRPLEHPLMQSLSRAVSHLPEVTRNPALRASSAMDELIKRISPIVMDWASRQCKDALTAQTLGMVVPWPPSIMQLVTGEHIEFSRRIGQPKLGVEVLIPNLLPSPCDATAVLPEAGIEAIASSAPNTPTITCPQSSVEESPGVDHISISLAPDEMELKLRRKAHRQITSSRGQIITAADDRGRKQTPANAPAALGGRKQVKTRALWKNKPAATAWSNRV